MKQRIALYIIAGLAGIGIIATLISNPWSVLIPVIIAGVIFLLWKFPPNRWKSPHRSGGKRGFSGSASRGASRGVFHGDSRRVSRGVSRSVSRSSGRYSPRGSNRTTKRTHLRVIPGNRKDEDDNPPAYH